MALKDTKFDAFISYRHAELDKFVAESIHKRLEAFRLPSSVKRKNKLAKDRISRVFRDRDELPLASDLAEQITAALENSEFLIVICTPRLPESKWCRKEIETFIEMHGRQNVFAVLAEGEPSESFPDLLLYDEKEVVSETGVTEIVRVPVEPLAADVRGANKKEIRKKMDEELLRLVAPMFNLNYDDLKQRHREQKMKRIVGLSMVISSIFIVFGIFSGILSLKISQQADEIFEQNQIITEKNEEILAQSSLLEKQNTDLLKSYAVSMSLESQKLILEGRKNDALYALRTAMPDSSADTSIPFTPQTQYALTDILNVYEPYSYFYPETNYDLQASVHSIKVSPDEKTILLQDDNNNLYICDINLPKPIESIELCNSATENYFDFYDDESILFNSSEGLIYYNFVTKESKQLLQETVPVYKIPMSDTFIIKTYDSILKTDLSGQTYWSYNTTETNLFSDVDISFSDTAEYMVISNYSVLVFMDTTNGECINSIEYTISNPSVLYENYFYFCVSDLQPKHTTFYCYDITTGSMVWSKQYNDLYIYNLIISKPDDTPYLIANDYNICYSYNALTGDAVCQTEFERGVQILSTTKNLSATVVSLYNGENHIFLPDSGTAVLSSVINAYPPNTQLADIIWLSGAYIYQYLTLPMVTYYTQVETPAEYQEICNNAANPTLNDKGDIYFTNDLENAYFYRVGEENPFLIVPLNYNTCRFIGDGSQYYMLYTLYECNIYSFTEEKPIYTIESDWSIEVYPDYIAETICENNEYFFRLHSLNEIGKVFDFESSDANYIQDELILAKNETDYVCINYSEGFIHFRSRKNSGKKHLAETTPRSIQSYALSDDGKYLFITHLDNRLEIYETASGTLVKTHYNISITLNRVIYNTALNNYLLSSLYSYEAYCLDTNMDFISHFTTYLNLSTSQTSAYCYNQNMIYELPIYSYDQLIQMTDNILDDYVPSEQILSKHNINQ